MLQMLNKRSSSHSTLLTFGQWPHCFFTRQKKVLRSSGVLSCSPVGSLESIAIQILVSFFMISDGVWPFFPRLISQPEFLNPYSPLHSLRDFASLHFLSPWHLQFLLLPWLPLPIACRYTHT